MATISIELSACNHLDISITHDGKTKTFTATKDELKRLFEPEEAFDILLKNLILYCRLSGITDWSQLKAQIESKEFRV